MIETILIVIATLAFALYLQARMSAREIRRNRIASDWRKNSNLVLSKSHSHLR